jgi:hypothetical protein
VAGSGSGSESVSGFIIVIASRMKCPEKRNSPQQLPITKKMLV